MNVIEFYHELGQKVRDARTSMALKFYLREGLKEISELSNPLYDKRYKKQALKEFRKVRKLIRIRERELKR